MAARADAESKRRQNTGSHMEWFFILNLLTSSSLPKWDEFAMRQGLILSHSATAWRRPRASTSRRSIHLQAPFGRSEIVSLRRSYKPILCASILAIALGAPVLGATRSCPEKFA